MSGKLCPCELILDLRLVKKGEKGTYTTASTANMTAGLTCSKLMAIGRCTHQWLFGEIRCINTYRSRTPSDPKSAAALTQIPPIAVVARQAATFSCV